VSGADGSGDRFSRPVGHRRLELDLAAACHRPVPTGAEGRRGHGGSDTFGGPVAGAWHAGAEPGGQCFDCRHDDRRAAIVGRGGEGIHNCDQRLQGEAVWTIVRVHDGRAVLGSRLTRIVQLRAILSSRLLRWFEIIGGRRSLGMLGGPGSTLYALRTRRLGRLAPVALGVALTGQLRSGVLFEHPRERFARSHRCAGPLESGGLRVESGRSGCHRLHTS
jgi:hypothetical protein